MCFMTSLCSYVAYILHSSSSRTHHKLLAVSVSLHCNSWRLTHSSRQFASMPTTILCVHPHQQIWQLDAQQMPSLQASPQTKQKRSVFQLLWPCIMDTDQEHSQLSSHVKRQLWISCYQESILSKGWSLFSFTLHDVSLCSCPAVDVCVCISFQ